MITMCYDTNDVSIPIMNVGKSTNNLRPLNETDQDI